MKYALIGKNIPYSFSPLIHAHLGNNNYGILDIPEDELNSALNKEGYGGFNVTVPYKRAVAALCSELSEEAAETGCINTVVKREGKLYGYNTDIFGMKSAAEKAKIKLKDKKVIILGSGATAHTAAYMCKLAKAGETVFVSRSGENNYDNISKHFDADIIINATPIGMTPYTERSLVDIGCFGSLGSVIEVNYNPLFSRLAAEALKKGIRVSSALYMLIAQAAATEEIFGGKAVEPEITDKLYRRLYAERLNVVLVGMPGCGKTALAKRLAESLNKKYVDTDEETEKSEGLSPEDIIKNKGESAFRKAESKVIEKAGALTGCVIATGGGCVTVKENYYPLKQNSFIVYIKRDTELLATDKRPLSTDLDKLYRERSADYLYFADAVIDNNGDIDGAVKKIAEAFYAYTCN